MEIFTIGRSRSCHIVISKEKSISRRHASITIVGPGKYEISDLSANGTFVDKQGTWEPIRTAVLGLNDKLRLGQFEISVRAIAEQIEGETDNLRRGESADSASDTEPVAGHLRLSAIVAMDLCNSTELMQGDESMTLRMLDKVVGNKLLPIFSKNGGHIVETAGDGFLAEFSIASNAVRAAVDAQRSMAEAPAILRDEKVIQFRCGATIGDVVARDNGIFGRAVNLAYRLEAMADPGGLCISSMLWELLPPRQQSQFRDMRTHQLKGFADPVRIFAFHPEA